jgi:hypothetical protein
MKAIVCLLALDSFAALNDVMAGSEATKQSRPLCAGTMIGLGNR